MKFINVKNSMGIGMGATIQNLMSMSMNINMTFENRYGYGYEYRYNSTRPTFIPNCDILINLGDPTLLITNMGNIIINYLTKYYNVLGPSSKKNI